LLACEREPGVPRCENECLGPGRQFSTRQYSPFALLYYEYIDTHGHPDEPVDSTANFYRCIGDFAILEQFSSYHENLLYYPFNQEGETNYRQRIPFELCRWLDIWKTPFTINELEDTDKLNDFILYMQLLWLEGNFNPDFLWLEEHFRVTHDLYGVKNLVNFKLMLNLGNKHTEYLQHAHHEIYTTINSLKGLSENFEAVANKPASLLDDMIEESDDEN